MATSIDAGDLFAAYQHTLQLKPVINTQALSFLPVAGTGYWAGFHNGVDRHCIELVGPDNLAYFKSSLQSGLYTRQPGSENAVTCMVIFSDGLECAGPLRQGLHEMATFQSPLSGERILQVLGNAFAGFGANIAQHGVAIRIGSQGILLLGASGTGKSAIALELLSRGHTLIADDMPLLARMPLSNRVYAICPPLLTDMLEVRAIGILEVSKIFGRAASTALSPLDLVIELVDTCSTGAETRLDPYRENRNILGVDLPRVQIPTGHATNPAVIVETLAKNHVLYQSGDAAGTNLIARQRELMMKQTV